MCYHSVHANVGNDNLWVNLTMETSLSLAYMFCRMTMKILEFITSTLLFPKLSRADNSVVSDGLISSSFDAFWWPLLPQK